MEITLEYLEQKRREYEDAYVKNLGLANANYGAMEAIDDLIKRLQNQPAEDVSHDHLG